MKYLLLLHQDLTRDDVAAMSDDERKALYAAWAEVRKHPGVTPGPELAPASTATTVRVQNGETLTTDGPFAQTKEAIGGWFVLEADDLDAAIEFAARVPTAANGAVEVRPLVER
jgi:hypothetical protein